MTESSIPDTLSESPAEIFDSLGRAEAAKTGNSVIVSHSLDCFPKDMEIYHTAQGGDVVNWWKLINQSSPRWEKTVTRQPEGDIDIAFEFPHENYVLEKNGIRYDSRFADIDENGNIHLNQNAINQGWDYSHVDDYHWFPHVSNQDEKHVVRGMNNEEMTTLLKTGIIQSRGDVVKDVGQKTGDTAWTYFYPASYIQGSFNHAANARTFYMPTFSNPSYVILLERTASIVERRGDLHSKEPVPIDNIKQIYEIRPISIQGAVHIDLKRLDTPKFGVVYSLGDMYEMDYPKIVHAFKEVTLDEVRKTLGITQKKKPDL